MGIFVVLFLVLIARLFHLQIICAEKYREIAREVGRTLQLTQPFRGRLLARDGQVLAQNEVYFDLVYTIDGLHPREKIFAQLDKVLGICVEPAHEPEYEICTCDLLERHLFEVLGPPRALAYDLLRDSDETGETVMIVNNIARRQYARLSRKYLRRLADNGVFFELDEESKTYSMLVEPRRILRMELALLGLEALCGVPYGAPVPALDQTLRGRVAAGVAAVRTHFGGEDLAANRRLNERRNSERIAERLLAHDIPWKAVTRVLYRSDRYPGVRVIRRQRRAYPLREVAGVITGYAKPAWHERVTSWREEGVLIEPRFFSPVGLLESFPTLRERGRFRDELLGVRGLERAYDDELRGLFGAQLIAVDSRNRPLPHQPFEPIEPVRGRDVTTTIDVALQSIVFDALQSACGDFGHGRAGSAVVLSLDRATGAIDDVPGAVLAMACLPTFDPGRMQSPDYYEQIRTQPGKPLFNRPVSPPRFPPPGSVFKLIVAVAAMESGVVDNRSRPLHPSETYECRTIFDERYRSYYRCRTSHGTVDVKEALEVSCNCFFYYLARDRLNAGILASWARNFGFGRPTGIDLVSSAAMERGRLAWEVPQARMPSYGIGDRYVEASTLQVARAVAAIGLGGGQLPVPYLVRPHPPETIEFQRRRTIASVREGMRRVLTGPGGTAAAVALGLRPFSAGVKTGTAQIARGRDDYYAWIAGFAPYRDPEIAFAICIEETPMHGGQATAPILERILEYFAEKEPGRYLPGERGGPGA